MVQHELQVSGSRLLKEARAIRAAYPDLVAMRQVPLGERPDFQVGDAVKVAQCRAVLGFVWDEATRVREGKAGTLELLDDEIAYAEWLMSGQ